MNGEKKFLTNNENININLEIFEASKERWLIVTHGIGEHLGRHKDYILELFSSSHNIAFYDLRGHGNSDGKKGWVQEFGSYYDDLQSVVSFLRQEYRLEKYILFGHSMGALITAGAIQKGGLEPEPEKVYLNAPPAAIPGALGKIVDFVKSDWLEKLSNNGKGLYLKGLVDLNQLSHNSAIKSEYVSDPLCLLSLHSALLFKMIKESRRVFSKPLGVGYPVFASVGSADKIVSAQALVEYFSFVEKNVRFKLIEGGFHEIHNEFDQYKKPYFEFLKTSLQ